MKNIIIIIIAFVLLVLSDIITGFFQLEHPTADIIIKIICGVVVIWQTKYSISKGHKLNKELQERENDLKTAELIRGLIAKIQNILLIKQPLIYLNFIDSNEYLLRVKELELMVNVKEDGIELMKCLYKYNETYTLDAFEWNSEIGEKAKKVIDNLLKNKKKNDNK
ncbi:MAG: hypothetical protein LBQ28_10905 [Prevotellaceae bacterium]|jgi:hypothetical protein|nr:hypothetical protein [Prevotellaceae bacterium]